VWRSLVARFVRDEEVAGSNPVTPTKIRGADRRFIRRAAPLSFSGFSKITPKSPRISTNSQPSNTASSPPKATETPRQQWPGSAALPSLYCPRLGHPRPRPRAPTTRTPRPRRVALVVVTAGGSNSGREGDLNCSVPSCAQNHESAFWPVNKGKLAGCSVDNCVEIPAPTEPLAPGVTLFAMETCLPEQRISRPN
jgi:hypothetical protein